MRILRTVLRQKQKYTGYEFDQRDAKFGWSTTRTVLGICAVSMVFSYYLTVFKPKKRKELEEAELADSK
ncbi:hypothetical protein DPMN_109566 [Dreissena polymorpha]|uniref:Uncharacterized protein n=1 Tax=Dreissena polymorpha TaxID=45954 RepID=A0A9D4KAT4_DREPO|nr:hypothetical protein DPMN_109566 [Dreissena polymorpha]